MNWKVGMFVKGNLIRMRLSLALALLAGLLICTILAVSQNSTLNLQIQKVMTADEMRDTGVSHMTPQQREAFNAWLNRYTMSILSISNRRASASAAAPTPGT